MVLYARKSVLKTIIFREPAFTGFFLYTSRSSKSVQGFIGRTSKQTNRDYCFMHIEDEPKGTVKEK